MMESIDCIEEGTTVVLEYRFKCVLHPNVYFLNAGVTGILDGEEAFLARLIDAAVFRVQPETSGTWYGMVDFCVEPSVRIQTQALSTGRK